MPRVSLPSCLLLCCLPFPLAADDDWPQFRGPNATGIAAGSYKLPEKIGPDDNLIWKVELSAGTSSPIVHGSRIYATASREQKLLTLALDRATGRVLWQAEAPHRELEKIHQIGTHAQSTPATDGEYVVSFFGSAGLFCYDAAGKEVWRKPMGPFKNDFGAGSSPVIVDGRVILYQDHDTDSFLAAYDLRTGKELWRTDRSEFPRNYATPVVWEADGKKQIVISATLRVVGYDLDTGKEVWTVRGTSRIVNMTPVVGGDGILYVATWSPGADPGDRIDVPPFAELVKENDKDGNGTLEEKEVPAGPLQQRFTQIDRDKDGRIDRVELDSMREVFRSARNVVFAVKPGGKGDISQSHVLWTYDKMLPYVPSPVLVGGHLFMVKNGGLLSCLNAKSGQPAKQGRVPGSANYYSSPVAGDGKIYLVSQRGDLSVISAKPEWEVLHRAKLGEDVMATPAIAGGRIYVRTAGHLICFGLPVAQ